MLASCWPRRRYPARNPDQNVADLQAQVAANEKGATSCAAWSRISASTRSAPTWATCRTTPRRAVRRVIDGADRTAAFALRAWTTAPSSGCAISRRPRARAARSRLHRHLAAAADNFNAPRRSCQGRRALRVPHAGRRRHPAERRLPEADRHRAARGLDARIRATRPPSSPATSRPRSAITDALYGALGVLAAGQGTMNNFTFGNEQLPVLRDHLRRLRAPGPASTAPAPCTPT